MITTKISVFTSTCSSMLWEWCEKQRVRGFYYLYLQHQVKYSSLCVCVCLYAGGGSVHLSAGEVARSYGSNYSLRQYIDYTQIRLPSLSKSCLNEWSWLSSDLFKMLWIKPWLLVWFLMFFLHFLKKMKMYWKCLIHTNSRGSIAIMHYCVK